MNEYEISGIESIARGVAIADGKILLCRAKGGKTSYLPGGHIEFGETGREALEREIREELGVVAKTGRFLGVVENSFFQHEKPHFEINLVYELIFTSPVEAKAVEDWIEFEWVKLEDLDSAKILPEVFNELKNYPDVFIQP
jgi:8-oxo-dGTP pyrophosphatase MutT (NUDIX family)